MRTLRRESEGEAAFVSPDFGALFLEGLVHRHLFYWTWEMMTEMRQFQRTRIISRSVRKIAKTAIIFVKSVRLSVSREKLGSHWTECHEI
jgi:hypothetical protein